MYFEVGIPIMAAIWIDWFCFGAMTLMAGYLSVAEQATQVLLLNILDQLFQVALGIQQSCS